VPPEPSIRPTARRAGPIRVLVVDDAVASQRAIVEMLRRGPDVQVVGCAQDGEEALRLALQLRPDCICLDLEMPRMDGFTFLRLLMSKLPVPVVVVSARSRKQDVFKALELGALDFVSKPDGGGDLASIRDELVSKIATVRSLRTEAAAGARRVAGRPTRLVAIGSSTGGPAALGRVLTALPGDLPLAYAVAQHMPERFTRTFAERLARTTGLDVREAAEGDELVSGRVLIAPGGRHLRVVRSGGPLGPVIAALSSPEPGDGQRYCPSVDLLFASASEAMGSRVCAVVLTGMGNDGRRGVELVKEAGGIALAESEESAVVYGMPKEAVETGKVDAVLPLEGIVARLCRFAEEG
jgi:two-component system chemotaxis response regulator CheB